MKKLYGFKLNHVVTFLTALILLPNIVFSKKILVKLEKENIDNVKKNLSVQCGYSDVHEEVSCLEKLGYVELEIPDEADIEDVASSLSESGVDSVEEDVERYSYEAPGRESFSLIQSLWALDKIKVPQAWTITKGNENIVIAVLDSGVDMNHPAIKARIISPLNCITKKDDAYDDNGHGTHCMGSVAGISDMFSGAAPNCKIMPIKVLHDGKGFSSWIAQGIIYAVDNGADVISMSLGSQRISKVEEDAIRYARDNNVLIVAAAGNSNSDVPEWPASSKEVISVGATDVYDSKTDFSNFGITVDVAAPGEDIFSTVVGGGYGIKSGTSMAAPYVAALCALLKSMVEGITSEEIEQLVYNNTDYIGGWLNHGRINYAKTLEATCKKYGSVCLSIPADVGMVTGEDEDMMFAENVGYSTDDPSMFTRVLSKRIEKLGQVASVVAEHSVDKSMLAKNEIQIQAFVGNCESVDYDVFVYNWKKKVYERVECYIPVSTSKYVTILADVPLKDGYLSEEGIFKYQFSAIIPPKRKLFRKKMPESFELILDMLRIRV